MVASTITSLGENPSSSGKRLLEILSIATNSAISAFRVFGFRFSAVLHSAKDRLVVDRENIDLFGLGNRWPVFGSTRLFSWRVRHGVFSFSMPIRKNSLQTRSSTGRRLVCT